MMWLKDIMASPEPGTKEHERLSALLAARARLRDETNFVLREHMTMTADEKLAKIERLKELEADCETLSLAYYSGGQTI
jgi:hypothetical protein